VNDVQLLISVRPDYVVPGAVVFVAFYVLWLSDRSQRYNLLFGIAAATSTAAAALTPVAGTLVAMTTPQRAAVCGLVTVTFGCYLAAAARFRGWSWSARSILRTVLVAAPLIALIALDRRVSAAYVDVAGLTAFIAAAWILWPMRGLPRLAAAIFVVRALNRGWLTQLFVEFELLEQVGLNLVLSYCTGIVLLSASCLRTLQVLRVERDALELQVAARSAELNGSRARLERANRDLEVFIDTVVGALRGPLDEMQRSSASLNNRLESSQAEGAGAGVTRLGAAVARMREMVEGLYALAHVASHELRREAVDVSAAAREVLQTLTESNPGARHQCVVAPGMVLRADPVLVRVVLDNLLGNAWKYSARATPPRVSVEPLPGGGEGFVVRDNGAGFDAHLAHKLFAPFQRLHDAREFEGTGVGLATVQRVVLRHGGRIRAEGAPGQGAAFFVNLPDVAALDRQPVPG
jgi:signal transduction histidine kinase